MWKKMHVMRYYRGMHGKMWKSGYSNIMACMEGKCMAIRLVFRINFAIKIRPFAAKGLQFFFDIGKIMM